MNYTTLPSQDIVTKAIEALKANGIQAESVSSSQEAKTRALNLIPKGAEVMPMTSITLNQTGIADEINNSGNYDSVRNKLNSMNRDTQNLEMQKIGAAPEYAIGSVHAVTEDGQIIIASNTGSQLPAYVYGSPHVIWVVGTQKIVKDLAEGMDRIKEYIVPLETQRARKAYNLPEFNTNMSKVLIINKEINLNRIRLIFVNENVGF